MAGRRIEQPGLALTIVAAIVLVAVLGNWTTDLGPWYAKLNQPSWKPPDSLFGPAWMLIYGFTGCAIYRAWRNAKSAGVRKLMAFSLVLNAALNVFWSVLFFHYKRPDWAFAEGLVLLASVVLMMFVFAPGSGTAAALLLPYLIWVSIAISLNLAVIQLNAPF